jgi:hypothetical protein
MKKLLLFLMFVRGLGLHAQIDSTLFQSTEVRDSTEIGKPDGNAATRVIGAAGGNIVSEDGRVELVFPAGALSTNTAISIQPTKNHAPNGSGKAYWFEPSGTQFKKPVQLIYRYTQEEYERCHPELMGFAMQDRKGKWSFIDYEVWDSASNSLKGYIHHFSGLSNVDKIRLDIYDFTLQCTHRASVRITDITRSFTMGDHTDQAFALLHPRDRIVWFVNDVRNGNDAVGHIQGTSDLSWDAKRQRVFATYTAPKILPKKNPVIIVASIYLPLKNNRREIRVLSDRIHIYDYYKAKIIHESTGRVGMGSELIDSATCYIFIQPPDKIWIDLIHNYPPTVLKEGKKAGIQEKLFVDNGVLGTLHITESVKLDSISHDYPPEVYIEFNTVTILTQRFQYVTRAGSSGIEPLFEPSLPQEINFIANGETQTYNVYTGGHTKYKLIVTPVMRN